MGLLERTLALVPRPCGPDWGHKASLTVHLLNRRNRSEEPIGTAGTYPCVRAQTCSFLLPSLSVCVCWLVGGQQWLVVSSCWLEESVAQEGVTNPVSFSPPPRTVLGREELPSQECPLQWPLLLVVTQNHCITAEKSWHLVLLTVFPLRHPFSLSTCASWMVSQHSPKQAAFQFFGRKAVVKKRNKCIIRSRAASSTEASSAQEIGNI